MGLLSAVTSRLEPEREPQETFAYQCGRCGAMFERPKSRMTRIRCPDCGASAVYAAEDDGEEAGRTDEAMGNDSDTDGEA